MENKLPKNWIEVSLSAIVKLQGGFAFKSKEYCSFDNGISIVRMGNISKKFKMRWNWDKQKYFPKSRIKEVDRYLLKKEDLLICLTDLSKSGDYLGTVALMDENIPALLNQRVSRFQFYGKIINKKYLYYVLIAPSFRKYATEETNGTIQQNTNHSYVLDFQFSIAPRTEQDRIVAKLDGLFEQLESINKSLDHIPTLLKNFRQQVLTQAVTGKLTEEWRAGKELEEWIPKKKNQNYRPWKISLPNDWNVYSFETIAEIQANLKNPDQYPDHILVAPNHIEKYTGRLIETQLTKDIAPKSDKHYFVKGSIVYSKIRPYLSKLIIAEFDGLCSADMYPIKANIEQRFLFYYMLSQIFLQYVTTAGERSILPKVNQKGLNNIPVPVPPLKEQQEIVKRVEILFAKADKLEEHFNALKIKMDHLPQAILNKAFKGELVAQFDSDGDAKDLLVEIERLKKEVKGLRREK